MVRKETCSNCKGNRYVRILRTTGDYEHRKCPTCDGIGYRIRVSLDR